MEYYLNRIYLGSGLYGVEAASKGYFGKPARDLTLGESAALAGLIKSPNNLSPWNDKARTQAARDFVLGRMVDEGYISPRAVPDGGGGTAGGKAAGAGQQRLLRDGGDPATGDCPGGPRPRDQPGVAHLHDHRRPVAENRRGSLREQLDEIERRPAFKIIRPTRSTAPMFHDEERRAAARRRTW